MTRSAFVVRACCAASLLLALAPAIAGGATVSGRVLAPPAPAPRPAMNPYPGRAHTVAAPENEAERAAYADVVVSLRGGGLTRGREPRKHELAQRGKAFVPRVLPILAGDTVFFPNFDPFYHNVFSYSPVRRFDLGKYSQGKSKSVVFPDPGEVRIFCDIHSEMNAVILVMETPYFVRPSEDGTFRLDQVPPGAYEVVLWHPDRAVKTFPIQVPSAEANQLVLGF